jgi:hypothetical protein
MLSATLLPLTPPHTNMGSSKRLRSFVLIARWIFFTSGDGLSIIRTF